MDTIYFRIRRAKTPKWLPQLLYNLMVRNVLQNSRKERWNSINRSIYAITLLHQENKSQGLLPWGAVTWKEAQGKAHSTRGEGRSGERLRQSLNPTGWAGCSTHVLSIFTAFLASCLHCRWGTDRRFMVTPESQGPGRVSPSQTRQSTQFGLGATSAAGWLPLHQDPRGP